MNENAAKTEKNMLADALSQIEDELISEFAPRLKALTGPQSICVSINYRNIDMAYSLDDNGSIIAMTSAEPERPYTFGPSQIPGSVDIFSCADNNVARAMVLFWRLDIKRKFRSAIELLEKEHAIIENFGTDKNALSDSGFSEKSYKALLKNIEE